MKKHSIYFIVTLLALGTGRITAQDFHFSQYDMVSIYTNPAVTGMYDGKSEDYRIVSDYRSQWKALGIKPYTTEFISYDMHLSKFDDKWGVGGYIVQDHAGEGRFQTLNVMGSGAYNIMNGTKAHWLTVGLQAGIFYKSFDPSSFTYDIQWDDVTGTFNQSADSHENFARTGMVKFDANMGVRYGYMRLNTKWHPFASFSINHLTMPNESFTDVKSHLPMKFLLNTACNYDVNDNLTLQGRVLYMNQRKAHDFDLGVMAFYKIKGSSLDVIGGIDYRVKDALIAHIGFRQGESIFRFSYDINTSYLNNYTNGRGAWEFGLVLTGKKNEPLFKPLF